MMKRGATLQAGTLDRAFLIVLVAMLCTVFSAGESLAQDNRVNKANYELAARFTSAKMRKMVFSTSVNPNWLEHSDRFWYSYETPDGRLFYIVDPARKSKVPLFDTVHMAAELTRLTGDPYDHQHLPIRTVKFIKEDKFLEFSVESTKPAELDTAKEAEEDTTGGREQRRGGRSGGNQVIRPEEVTLHFEYEIATGKLTIVEDYEEPKRPPSWASISPDEQTIIFARDHNLFTMDAENFEKAKEDEQDSTIVEQQLTTDGEEYFSFGSAVRRNMDEEEREKNEGKRTRASVIWSPDSKKFVVSRRDQRTVKDLWVINSLAEPRPTLETYKYDMPGEEDVTQTEIYVFDVASAERTNIEIEEFKDQSVSVHTKRRRSRPSDEGPQPSIWLSPDPNEIYITRTSRNMHKVDFCVADATTGEVRVVIEERMNTYIETQRPQLINEGTEIIWWAERDGWGHFYLYGTDGILKNQITKGPYHCAGIQEVDEKSRVIYFTANAREMGEDPYFAHFYKVKLNGSGLQLLNPGNFNHSARVNEDMEYFVDTYSRVDVSPTSVLYDTKGQLLMELEKTNISRLLEAGYKFPEPYRVKADDGITDLFGVMYKPFDFDESKKYPIIAYVYPGPQTESVNKSWSTDASNNSLAQFGFIVITIGNRGGHPSRSKWYHNYGYGNLRDYGLADKKAAIEQLAARHSFIDIDRVGIYGHSGGGFMSTAAMLVYPEFFKVAVSSSGNHENNVYNKQWSEKHHGVTEVLDQEGKVFFEYDIEKNSELAANLKGHLLLTTGDIDNNVHPANTFRMAAALIRANKRFDFFIFPGQRHGYGNMGDYWFWLRAEYFCKHLLGDVSTDIDMLELIREQEQSGGSGQSQGRGRGIGNR